MFFSQKKKLPSSTPRTLEDIRKKDRDHVLSLQKRDFIIRVSRESLAELFGKKGYFAGYALVVLFILFIAGFSFVSKADVAYFYPASCLGGWENSGQASGEPEFEDSTSLEDFNETNAAHISGASASLFCGEFTGVAPEGTVPESFVLGFSMSVDDGSVDHSIKEHIIEKILESDEPITDEIMEETGETETDEATNDAPEISDTSEEAPSPQEENEGTDEVSETNIISDDELSSEANEEREESESDQGNDTPVSFFEFMAQTAHAEEIDSTLSAPSDAPSETSEPSEQNEDTITSDEEVGEETVDEAGANEEIIPSDLIQETVSEDMPVVTEEEVPDQIKDPSDAFLEVRYTLDGKEWHSLGKVSRREWRDATFDIPLTSWEEIPTLQIEVVTVPTFDEQSVIYVDALELSVSYLPYEEIKTQSLSSDQKKYTVASALSTSEAVTVEKTLDPDQGEGMKISAKEGGAYRIYSRIDPTFFAGGAIGTDPITLQAYDFFPGEFSFVFTREETGCSGRTIEECTASANYRGEITFVIEPTTLTPAEFLIAPFLLEPQAEIPPEPESLVPRIEVIRIDSLGDVEESIQLVIPEEESFQEVPAEELPNQESESLPEAPEVEEKNEAENNTVEEEPQQPQQQVEPSESL